MISEFFIISYLTASTDDREISRRKIITISIGGLRTNYRADGEGGRWIVTTIKLLIIYKN